MDPIQKTRSCGLTFPEVAEAVYAYLRKAEAWDKELSGRIDKILANAEAELQGKT